MLIWFDSENVGDNITPYLYNKLGRQIKVGFRGKRILGAGSIINHGGSDTVVWGTGALPSYIDYSVPLVFDRILSVRGPLTAHLLSMAGVPEPTVYGDPGLMLSRVFEVHSPKKYRVGLVPHSSDADSAVFQGLRDSIQGSTVIEVRHRDVERFIREISSCDYIISSSLHGIIISDSYGIPNVGIRVGSNVISDYFKFEDYLLSVGRDPVRDYLSAPSGSYTGNNKDIKTWANTLLSHLKDYKLIESDSIDAVQNTCPFMV